MASAVESFAWNKLEVFGVNSWVTGRSFAQDFAQYINCCAALSQRFPLHCHYMYLNFDLQEHHIQTSPSQGEQRCPDIGSYCCKLQIVY